MGWKSALMLLIVRNIRKLTSDLYSKHSAYVTWLTLIDLFNLKYLFWLDLFAWQQSTKTSVLQHVQLMARSHQHSPLCNYNCIINIRAVNPDTAVSPLSRKHRSAVCECEQIHTLRVNIIEAHRLRVFDQVRQSSGQLHGLLLSVRSTKVRGHIRTYMKKKKQSGK